MGTHCGDSGYVWVIHGPMHPGYLGDACGLLCSYYIHTVVANTRDDEGIPNE